MIKGEPLLAIEQYHATFTISVVSMGEVILINCIKGDNNYKKTGSCEKLVNTVLDICFEPSKMGLRKSLSAS